MERLKRRAPFGVERDDLAVEDRGRRSHTARPPGRRTDTACVMFLRLREASETTAPFLTAWAR